MKCLNCEQEFVENTVTQKYCCKKCKNQYYNKTTKEERIKNYPSIIFKCAKCDKIVETDSSQKIDMRTKFCSEYCEKKYWK